MGEKDLVTDCRPLRGDLFKRDLGLGRSQEACVLEVRRYGSTDVTLSVFQAPDTGCDERHAPKCVAPPKKSLSSLSTFLALESLRPHTPSSQYLADEICGL